MNNPSSTVNNLEWRRSNVLESSSQGYTQSEIAKTLQVSNLLLIGDLAYLAKQAQQSLQKHIHEIVPEYQKCMVGMKRNLKQTLK